ncbi:MAG: single-stranded DNA-binding protein [Propionibacteriaceae bacterium]|jgi:single-strand DNA-binding protein|nr:single-stranded DNA-binding protein [Propionibacteriaceae bacterium]
MDISITLTGRLGGEVDLKTTRSGVPMASFRLGSTPRIRRDDAWTDGLTTWISVVCYRALAENAAQSLSKGDPVMVEGRLRTSAWTDPQGDRHERLVVEASAIGHDLSWGTSLYRRAQRHLAGAGSDPAEPTDPAEAVDPAGPASLAQSAASPDPAQSDLDPAAGALAA